MASWKSAGVLEGDLLSRLFRMARKTHQPRVEKLNELKARIILRPARLDFEWVPAMKHADCHNARIDPVCISILQLVTGLNNSFNPYEWFGIFLGRAVMLP